MLSTKETVRKQLFKVMLPSFAENRAKCMSHFWVLPVLEKNRVYYCYFATPYIWIILHLLNNVISQFQLHLIKIFSVQFSELFFPLWLLFICLVVTSLFQFVLPSPSRLKLLDVCELDHTLQERYVRVEYTALRHCVRLSRCRRIDKNKLRLLNNRA